MVPRSFLPRTEANWGSSRTYQGTFRFREDLRAEFFVHNLDDTRTSRHEGKAVDGDDVDIGDRSRTKGGKQERSGQRRSFIRRGRNGNRLSINSGFRIGHENAARVGPNNVVIRRVGREVRIRGPNDVRGTGRVVELDGGRGVGTGDEQNVLDKVLAAGQQIRRSSSRVRGAEHGILRRRCIETEDRDTKREQRLDELGEQVLDGFHKR